MDQDLLHSHASVLHCSSAWVLEAVPKWRGGDKPSQKVRHSRKAYQHGSPTGKCLGMTLFVTYKKNYFLLPSQSQSREP